MLKSGLVSITFRELDYKKIIELVKEAGLNAVEWGGDIHVPHGNLEKAKAVKNATEEANLEVAAYGSYYRVGCERGDIDCSFSRVLETAKTLGAPVIRVWAGNKGSAEADENWWQTVIEKTREISSLAEKEGIRIAFEYHGGTLTDTNETALRLLKEVNHDNVYTYWQPAHNQSVAERKTELENVLPWLENIHVFYWKSHDRLPLKKGKGDWKEYCQVLKQSGRDHYLLLEFVQNSEPDQFFKDAQILKEILS